MKLLEWNKELIEEAKELMENKGYSVDSAMEKVWDTNYCSIACSDEVDVNEIRSLFWDKGFSELDEFNEEILGRYE